MRRITPVPGIACSSVEICPDGDNILTNLRDARCAGQVRGAGGPETDAVSMTRPADNIALVRSLEEASQSRYGMKKVGH